MNRKDLIMNVFFSFFGGILGGIMVAIITGVKVDGFFQTPIGLFLLIPVVMIMFLFYFLLAIFFNKF